MCSDIQLLNILRIVRLGVTTVTILVPVVLLIFVLIDIVKTIASGNVDTKKLFGSVSKRVIAAFLIFLIPVILNFVLSIVGNAMGESDSLYYLHCYNNANTEYINQEAKKAADEAILEANQRCGSGVKDVNAYEKARKAVRAIPDKEIRKDYESTIANLKSKCN